MKTKILIAILTVGIVSISTIKAQEKAKIQIENTANTAYACPMHCEGEKTYLKAGSCPICNMDLKKVEMKMAELYVCPMHSDVKSDKPGTCTKCKMDLKKMEMKMDHAKMNHNKIAKTYSCPMHPDVKSDKPGSCTNCGMDLKKMEIKN